ncbi:MULTISPECIES: hypothetical protein [unclassified Streptomyces]|uniref:hypothetical protein n=1 Tax=unclassified Streptomyces TaxID=2593676 RepID=UPI0013A706E8|nr:MULTISPECIES: hypothetical protein [unclassified Streptomyces]QZZ30304.1 hypothetical protein A7X85_32330 [Streptomyces sp. ST1015]
MKSLFMGPAPRKSALRKSVLAAVATMAATGGLLAGAHGASAADDNWYDPSALLTSCRQNVDGLGRADRCRFEPAKREVFTGPARQVGTTVHACSSKVGVGRQTTESRTEENSVSVTAGVEAGLSQIFSASIEASYGHSWSYSTSETEEVSGEVPPYSIGAVTIAPAMQRVTGRMVINYPKRRHGHYEWYVYPTLTQYDPDEMQFSTTTFDPRPMTANERRSMCGGPGGTANAPAASHVVIHLARPGYRQGAELSAKPRN